MLLRLWKFILFYLDPQNVGSTQVVLKLKFCQSSTNIMIIIKYNVILHGYNYISPLNTIKISNNCYFCKYNGFDNFFGKKWQQKCIFVIFGPIMKWEKAKNPHEFAFNIFIYDYSFYIYIVKHIFLFSD